MYVIELHSCCSFTYFESLMIASIIKHQVTEFDANLCSSRREIFGRVAQRFLGFDALLRSGVRGPLKRFLEGVMSP